MQLAPVAVPSKIKYSRVKFYADTPAGDVNKLFTWRVGCLNDVSACVARFIKKGWRIRAIFFEWVNERGVVVENIRIPKDSLSFNKTIK